MVRRKTKLKRSPQRALRRRKRARLQEKRSLLRKRRLRRRAPRRKRPLPHMLCRLRSTKRRRKRASGRRPRRPLRRKRPRRNRYPPRPFREKQRKIVSPVGTKSAPKAKVGLKKSASSRAKTTSALPAAAGFSDKTLVIVESPTKAKTLTKILGSKYVVKSSVGHIRDLPKSRLAIDVENVRSRVYPRQGKGEVKNELVASAKQAPRVLSRLRPGPRRRGDRVAPRGAARHSSGLRMPRPFLRDHPFCGERGACAPRARQYEQGGGAAGAAHTRPTGGVYAEPAPWKKIRRGSPPAESSPWRSLLSASGAGDRGFVPKEY